MTILVLFLVYHLLKFQHFLRVLLSYSSRNVQGWSQTRCRFWRPAEEILRKISLLRIIPAKHWNFNIVRIRESAYAALFFRGWGGERWGDSPGETVNLQFSLSRFVSFIQENCKSLNCKFIIVFNCWNYNGFAYLRVSRNKTHIYLPLEFGPYIHYYNEFLYWRHSGV